MLKRDGKPNLAYVYKAGGDVLPPLMFLGGFRSDMEGTKAVFLESFCQKKNQEFIRFDYSGHGQSEGRFEDGCISDWAQNAVDVLTHCTSRPAILVGSSMGGWVSLLLAQNHPEHVQAVIGLAAAPDFTTWMEADMNEKQKTAVAEQGYFELENDYDAPYVITQKLLDDGRCNALLDKALDIKAPMHLIQGKQDTAVPWEMAEKIKKAAHRSKVDITYIDDGDHRLSSPGQLEILKGVVERISAH